MYVTTCKTLSCSSTVNVYHFVETGCYCINMQQDDNVKMEYVTWGGSPAPDTRPCIP